MTNREKIAAALAIGAAVLVVAAAACLMYAVHNANNYRSRIVAYARQKTGLDIAIGHVAVGVFPLTVRLLDVEIKNPKPFPAGDFLKAPSVAARVDVGMLFHRKVAFHTIVLDHPVIDFISDPDGLWNFQNPATPKQAAKKPPRFSMGSIAKLQVMHGTLLGSALIDPADTPGPVVFEVQNFSGQLKQIHFNAFRAPGAPTAVAGSLHADAARFGDIHLAAVSSQMRILPEQLTFKGFHAKTYRGSVNGDFTFNFAGKKTKFATQIQVSGIGPGYLLKEFVSGPEIVTGLMTAEFKLAGEVGHTANPLAGIGGGGKFTIGKGEMPGLDHNQAMLEAKRFRKPAAAALPPSAFSSFTADMELKDHHIYSRRIQVDFYGVDASGGGDMNDANSALDYHGTVVIEKKQGIFTTVLARLFKGAKEKDGRLAFPVRLVGTWNDPRFTIVKGKK